ncbi:MAG: dTMP kinase [Spirochaetes bacterium]|nr:dTMP kinase [Spirochaetota bacterium]
MEPTILQRFVVLEGLDGSGTTTQMKLLAERLEREGRPHAATWEPTNGPVGSLIRSILSKRTPAHPRTVALLFAADRNEHLYEPGTGIAERTKRGEIVICDRYLFSSLAYQSLESDPDYVLSLNSSFPLPQLLVFLDTPVEVCQERLARRGSAELYDGFAFQSRVRAEYLKAIERFRGTGMRIERIAGDRPAGLIHGEIWKILAGMPIQKV